VAEPVVVVGGSVAALAAAAALGERGRAVRLLLPERGIGGGFAALRHDGRTLDLGVRVLELGYEDEPAEVPPLADYAPGIGGHRPYVRLVREWAQDLVGERLADAGRPRMVVGGRWADDALFTVELTGLAGVLPAAERAAIAAEAARAVAAEGDAGVLGAPGLEALSFAEASRRNHGETLHARFAALADKYWPGGAEALPATLRRKAWMALFWPRTVREAMAGEPPTFVPRRPFHTVEPDGPGALIAALLERVESLAPVTAERAGRLERLGPAPGGVRLTFGSGAEVTARDPVLAAAPGEVFAAAGIAYAPERVRTVAAWVEVPQDALRELPPLVQLLDAELPAARISRSGGGAPAGMAQLCVELRHDLPEGGIGRAAEASLRDSGMLFKDVAPMPIRHVAMPTFTAPTRAAAGAFAAARDELLATGLPVRLTGAAADFAADSLNEQVVGALQVAEERA